MQSPPGNDPRAPLTPTPGAATPATLAAAAIEARGLVKTYPGPGKTRVRALDGLTLAVAKGTIFALVGPNGAGKTTTVKILTTLASPDEGTATVEGIDVIARPGTGPPGHRRRRAALGCRPGGHRTGEPDPPGAPVRHAHPGGPRPGR